MENTSPIGPSKDGIQNDAKTLKVVCSNLTAKQTEIVKQALDLVPIAVDKIESADSPPLVEETAPEAPEDLSAQTSAPNAQFDAATESEIANLKQMIDASEKNNWAIGDLIVALTINAKGKKPTLKTLEQRTGWKQSRLCMYRNTCLAFPPNQRKLKFWDYEKLVAATRKIAGDAEDRLEQNPTAEQTAILNAWKTPNYQLAQEVTQELEAEPKEVTIQKGKKQGQKKTVFRKAKPREIAKRLGEKLTAELAAVTPTVEVYQPHPILDHCIHSTCEDLLQGWIEKGVDLKFPLIGADVPYGQYTKHTDGHLDQNCSVAAFTDAMNISEEKAIETTCNTIALVPQFLAKGGAFMLWQSCDYLRAKILAAIEAAGLEIEIMLVWHKLTPAPGNLKSAWTRKSECCYVVKHAGDLLINRDHSLSRSNVLEGSKFWFDKAVDGDNIEGYHWWRKPISLMEFLVRKHTDKGDAVLDLFACSGSLSKAAINLGRRFVYVEGKQSIFDQFSPLVLTTLGKAQAANSLAVKSEAKENGQNDLAA